MRTLSRQHIAVAERTVLELAIPQRFTKNIRAGDFFRAEKRGKSVVLCRAHKIPPDQAWFHTPEWQAKEREVDKDIRRGKMDGPYASARAMFEDFGLR